MQCDLLVLGDTPEAWAAATDAARLGARIVMFRPEIDSRRNATGIAAVLAAFDRDTGPYLADKPTCGIVRPSDLWRDAACAHERRVAENIREWGIQAWQGPARLTGPSTAEIFSHGRVVQVEAKVILVAVGTTAPRTRDLELEETRMLLPEDVARCDDVPRRLTILGGNPTGQAFGRLFAAAGSDVTLIDAQPALVSDHQMRIVHGDVLECRGRQNDTLIRLTNGRAIESDAILLAINRRGATATLGLAAAGLEADDRERLWCDDLAMTWVPTIAAAGEVIGYPRGLRGDRQRVRRTLMAQLGLMEQPSSQVISIHIDEGAPIPEPAGDALRVRTRPRPRPTLRVYHGW